MLEKLITSALMSAKWFARKRVPEGIVICHLSADLPLKGGSDHCVTWPLRSRVDCEIETKVSTLLNDHYDLAEDAIGAGGGEEGCSCDWLVWVRGPAPCMHGIYRSSSWQNTSHFIQSTGGHVLNREVTWADDWSGDPGYLTDLSAGLFPKHLDPRYWVRKS